LAELQFGPLLEARDQLRGASRIALPRSRSRLVAARNSRATPSWRGTLQRLLPVPVPGEARRALGTYQQSACRVDPPAAAP